MIGNHRNHVAMPTKAELLAANPFEVLGNSCDCLASSRRHAMLDALLAVAPTVAATAFDNQNRSLLNLAAYYGNLPALKILIAAGSDVRHQDLLGDAPLHHALQCATCTEEVSLAVAQQLLASGADPDAKGANGRTPKELAASRHWTQSVPLLSLEPSRFRQPAGNVSVFTNETRRRPPYVLSSRTVEVFEGRGVYGIPQEHLNSCDGYSGTRPLVKEPLSSSEWDWFGDELRSGERKRAMLPFHPPLPCNESFRQYLQEPELRQIVETSSIAFGVMVRDAEGFLERNLRIVMSLGATFKSLRIFFTENDSKDGSKQILANFTKTYPDIFRGEMRDGVSANTSVGLCESAGESRNCYARIAFLSSLRQRVFDMAMAEVGWDALVMLDLDFLLVTKNGFWQAFAIGMKLNAAAVFGQSVYRNTHGHCVLYDSAANIMEHYVPRSTKQSIQRGKQMKLLQKGCVGLVQGGHSGFPILYSKALRAANPTPRYSGHNWSSPQWGPRVVDLVPFNLMLSASAMNASLPPHERRPLILYGPFRPMYNWGEAGLEASRLSRGVWWKD